MGVPIGGGGRCRKRGRETTRGGPESERLGIKPYENRARRACWVIIVLIPNSSSQVVELVDPEKS